MRRRGVMRVPRFTEEQIAEILKGAENTGQTSECFGRHGIAKKTLYRWRYKSVGPR